RPSRRTLTGPRGCGLTRSRRPNDSPSKLSWGPGVVLFLGKPRYNGVQARARRGGSGGMREDVQIEVDAVIPKHDIRSAPFATLATHQEENSKRSKSSTGVPPFSCSCTPKESVQGSADGERRDLHDSDRGRATVATPATQAGQSREDSAHGSPAP